jgi:hypothetical protein
LVVFALAALPSIIKLYTLQGILWTKIIASIYFVSFLSIEVVIWVSKPYDQMDTLQELSIVVGDHARGEQWQILECIAMKRSGRQRRGTRLAV